jgi:hypothetical protein
MHRLAIGSLLLALVQGCIIVDDTEENGTATCAPRAEGDGACFAITAVCPADAVTYSVIVQPTGVSGAFDPDVFDCGVGSSILVDPGTYDIRVEATTAEGDVFFGSEPFLEQEVADLDDVPLTFEFPTGQGFFWLNWRIVQGETEITCEDIGAASVEVESELTSEGTSVTDVLPCVYGGWQTRALDLGEYDVRVSLLDDGGAVLGTTDPILTDLTEDTVLVELPDIVFALEPPAVR